VLSAARSLVFNAALGQRVRDGSWCTLLAGDVANLDGRGSVFKVDAPSVDLAQRLQQLEVHPTGPMWGNGELMSAAAVLEMEERIGQELARPCQYVLDAGLRQERRSLRLKVRDLAWEQDADGVLLRFWLRSGSFATAVLREILADPASADHSSVVDADDA
jgi:tRNA pseudouridine13 synthase